MMLRLTIFSLAAMWTTSLSAQEIVFSDSVFDDANWTATIAVDTTEDGAASESEQRTPGGNPDEYRWTKHTFNDGSIIVVHFREDWVYDPSTQGEIDVVGFSYDLKRFAGIGDFGVRYRLVLEQNGLLYESTAGDIITGDAWVSYSYPGQTEGDFFLQDETAAGAPPDFSDTGSPIKIGYRTSNFADAPREFESGIDNLTIMITAAGSPTPVEPATWSEIKADFR